jgi:uncharacterized protein
LSKDALAGTVPLRTFGQLKQLWEARTGEGPPTSVGEAAELFSQAPADHALPAPEQPPHESEPAGPSPIPAPETDSQPDPNSF